MLTPTSKRCWGSSASPRPSCPSSSPPAPCCAGPPRGMWRAISGLTVDEPAAALLRPGRGRGRPSRSGGGRLRGLRRAAHARRGDDGTRRAGGDELTDRELPGVSHGRLRCRPHPAGDHPGREVRGQPHRAVHRRLARKPCRISGGAAERRERGRRTGRHRRNRRLLPPAGGLTIERLRRQRRVLRGHRDGGAHVRRLARGGRRGRQLGRPGGHLS